MMMPAMRVKMEFAPVVNDILDQLPAEVWMSDCTTFLDPAFGGGQFLREIERRLREAGHSQDNISSRVYGCEIRQIRLNWTWDHGGVKTRNLIKTDFVSYDGWGDMKFDVIVGNPPYQSDKRTGTQPLWPLFVQKCHHLLKEDGHMALVIPNKWCGHTTNVIKGGIHLYSQILKDRMVACNIQECTRYFPGVGGYADSFSWFMINNSGSSQFITTTQDGTYTVNSEWFTYLPLRCVTKTTSSILSKLNTGKSYQFKQVSTGFKNTDNGSVVISMAQRLHYDKLNIYWDKSSGVTPTSKSTVSQVTFSKSSQKKVQAVFRSKLFKFIHHIYWNNDNFGTTFYNSLPYVDLNKMWDDKSLYDLFKLSSEEVEYIEHHVA